MYTADIYRFMPHAVHSVVETADASEVLAAVAAITDDAWILDLIEHEDGVSLNVFIAWFRDGRARVRVDDCLEHIATEPGRRDHGERGVVFIDDDGTSFVVAAEEALTRAQGIESLRYFLHNRGKRWPALVWT